MEDWCVYVDSRRLEYNGADAIIAAIKDDIERCEKGFSNKFVNTVLWFLQEAILQFIWSCIDSKHVSEELLCKMTDFYDALYDKLDIDLRKENVYCIVDKYLERSIC